MEKRQILINNLLINYYFKIVENSNLNIIFIHGWRSDSRVWEDTIKNLEYNCFALDLPGAGESQTPTTAFTLDSLSEIISGLIVKLQLKNIVLIGHSNGGTVSIKTILKDQNNFKALVLVDSAGIRQNSLRKRIIKIVAKALKPVFKLSYMQPLRRKIYSMIGSDDYLQEPKLKESFINIVNEDITPILKNLDIPTLLVWGDKDKSTPISDAELMKREIKDSTLKIIPDTGHFSFIENKELYQGYLIEFLENIE